MDMSDEVFIDTCLWWNRTCSQFMDSCSKLLKRFSSLRTSVFFYIFIHFATIFNVINVIYMC